MDRNGLSNLRKLSRILAIFVAMLIMFSCTGEPPKPDDIQGDGYAYTKEWAAWYITNQLIKNGNVPSVVMALVDDQEVVWQEAFGYADLEEQKFTSAETLYRMGSLSKQVTALAIMKLYEEGIIDLDAPITDYLPDFSMQTRFPDSDPITIRSIMAHRSGLPYFGNRFLGELAGLDSYEKISLKEIIDSLEHEYVTYPVGYRMHYSNVAFTLLGRIIEVMTGREFAEYMQENILIPLGMMNSSFVFSGVVEEEMAMGYALEEGKPSPQLQLDYSDLPPANLYSTLNDMTGYLKCLLNKGQVNGNQLLRNETFEMLFVDSYSKPTDPNRFGLSWFLSDLSTDHTWVSHGGGVNGFATFMGFLPDEKLGFIILSNILSDNQDATLISLGYKVIELMLETKLGIKPVEKDIPEPVNVDNAILAKYTGKYGMFSPLEVTLKNNSLQLQGFIPRVELKIIPISETKFRLSTPIALLAEKFVGRKLAIEFVGGNEAEENIMLLGDGYGDDYRWMVCPKIPDVEEVPPLWNELSGKYNLETYFSEGTSVAELQIDIVDNVLTGSFVFKTGIGASLVLNPINDEEVLVIGGLYDGETMFYDSDTGYLRWAGMIAKPKEKLKNFSCKKPLSQISGRLFLL